LEDTFVLRVDKESIEGKKKARKDIAAYIRGESVERIAREKNDHRKDVGNSLMAMTTLTGVFTIIISSIVLLLQENTYIETGHTLSLVTILIMMTVALITITYTRTLRIKRKKEIEEDTLEYRKKLLNVFEVDKNIDGNNSQRDYAPQTEEDALKRMLVNLEDINEFYKWSKTQAKGAFILAVFMCMVGLALIIGAVFNILLFSAPINVTIITGVGGVIVELVAGTALVVYRSSLSQLNHYHQALHEDERFLSSVTLISKFSNDEAKEEMLKEIIRSELQMNLDAMKLTNFKET